MDKALKKKLSLLLIALLFLFMCTACGNDSSDSPTQTTPTPEPTPISSTDSPARVESDIIGSWRWDSSTEYIYTFHKDGTGAYTYGGQVLPFDYIDNGDSVSIQYPNSTAPNVFRYHINGVVLSIEDSFGQYVTYIKTDSNGNPMSPLALLNLNVSSAQTTAMSNFMYGGYYAISEDTVYGLAHNTKGIQRLVSFDLSRDGDFVKAANGKTLDKDITPNYLVFHEENLYYIRDNNGIYKIPKTGGNPVCIIEDACEYLQIVGNSLYYCDGNYIFHKANLDGSNIETVLDKEIYYAYLPKEDWLIYQDDADYESLHLRHLPTGVDVALTNCPSYNPIIVESTVYFVMEENGIPTLARIDLSNIDITYDANSRSHQYSFQTETTGKHVGYELFINKDSYCYFGLNQGYHLSLWETVERTEDVLERTYPYLGNDYEVQWIYDEDGLVDQIYITLNATGGSQAIPRFD